MSLEDLYDRHAQALFRFLLNLMRDTEETRDVLQEVFVRLARRPEMLRGVRDTRGFLLRVAHNLAVDAIRRKTARTRQEEAFHSERAELFAATADPDGKWFSDALSRALGTLPSEQRAVVHLKLWEGLTFDEISQTLGISANTAASRFRYGLDKLGEALRPIYEECDE